MSPDDFDFELPEALIAQHPPEVRGDSRMLVIDRAAGKIEHRHFSEFTSYLAPADRLILNDTRVVPARFFSNDGRIELLRLEQRGPRLWKSLVKPGKRMKPGRTVQIGDATGTVTEILPEGGERIIEWDIEPDEETHGHLALPHYIDRDTAKTDADRYQTTFAQHDGAIAAPTAGLHFTPELIGELPHSFVTLHVGLGTFRPVSADHVEDHVMHSERYTLSQETIAEIENTRANGGKITAVGTTVVRVLEACAAQNAAGALTPQTDETNIFIYPPYEFRSVDRLLTNFHLPKSTLLMLVSAFAGKDLVMEAYRQAVEEKYRFYSYGDCMLLL